MITEDYVRFETAKLLKEKGFEGDTSCYYTQDSSKRWVYQHYHDFDKKDRIECPTIQMTLKWLREVHKLSIEPYYSEVLAWVVDIKHIDKHTSLSEFEAVRDKNYDSYEKACEAAIKYCLENLI